MENTKMSYREFCDFMESRALLFSAEGDCRPFRVLRDGYRPLILNAEDYALVRKINEKENRSSSGALVGDHILIRVGAGTVIRSSMKSFYEIYRKAGIHGVSTMLSKLITSCPVSDTSSLEKLHTFAGARQSLYIRPINLPANEVSLQNAVYRSIGDIALVLYFLVRFDGTNMTWTKVPKDLFLSWGKSEDEVFDMILRKQAEENPPRIFVNPFDAQDENAEGGDFMNDPDFELHLFSFLTTKKSRNGAIALFYPGVAGRIAQMAGGSFYAAFTCVDAVHIHKKADLPSPSHAAGTVESINRDLPDKENNLSDLIFEYDAEAGKLKPVAGSAQFEL